MDQPQRPEIAIVGPGKVGTALGVLLAGAGWPVVAVGGRDDQKTSLAARRIAEAGRQVTAACDIAEAARRGKIVLLTVSDDAISPLCEQLAAAGAFGSGQVVAHCSGAISSDALGRARAAGAAVGSIHPLQTFPTVEAAVVALGGAWFFIEGDESAAGVLEQLAGAIGGRAVRLEPGAKALYHAAACVASNYLVELVDAASQMEQLAGVDRGIALTALGPLVKATLDNVLLMGPEAALTGPIARGDVGTVERHLAILVERAPGFEAFYRQAGLLTVDLARRKGTLSAEAASELLAILNPPEPGSER
jgi:predicted short-subunit dehydrogenase-like oxidoreductase (DUF2520 family)